MKSKRREFLRHLAAGSAVVTMPAFLQGCGISQEVIVKEPMPEDPFLDWFQIDRNMIARVMSALSANGADSAEIFLQHRRETTLRMQSGETGPGQTDILQGVGLRVIAGQNVGFASTEDLSLEGMLAAAKRASASISSEPVIPAADFQAKSMGNLYLTNLAWADTGADQKTPILRRVDGAARAADPSIDNVTVSWSDIDERILIATLDGHLILDHRPMVRLSAQVSAAKGEESHSGFANIAARADLSWCTNERIDEMAREAVQRTLILFEARRPPSGEMPVMLAAGTSGVLLHEAIGHSLEADFNRNGKSIYADKLNERVADSTVSIVDQGTLPKERGALNYDDEGNICGRTAMVENGVLRSYLHDTLSARHYGSTVTGSGRRRAVTSLPTDSTTSS